MESGIVQQLLEICLMDFEKGGLEEVEEIICVMIHESFIKNPILAKLVHFQGYSPKLLKVTVDKIDSMHICFEFIPELLNHPQKQKQIFGIQLLSHLSVKYPIAMA